MTQLLSCKEIVIFTTHSMTTKKSTTHISSTVTHLNFYHKCFSA